MILRTLEKTKPWYGAGKIFGWKGAGIGINARIINTADMFEIKLLNKKYAYYISSEKIKEVYKKYSSVHVVKGVSVIIVPFFELDKDVEKFIKKNEQKSLF